MQLFEPAIEELPILTDNEMIILSPRTLLLPTKVTPCSVYALIHWCEAGMSYDNCCRSRREFFEILLFLMKLFCCRLSLVSVHRETTFQFNKISITSPKPQYQSIYDNIIVTEICS